jgi:DNA-directed RNA polymerase specialized sigma24 family protein
MSQLASSPLDHLLAFLDSDRATAAEKYEELRSRIVQMLLWRGIPNANADSSADVVLDRIGAKIRAGEVIDNVSSYAAGVARFVALEHLRKKREIAVDELPERMAPSAHDDTEEADQRLAFLRRCLMEIGEESDRRLILLYYDTESNEKTKDARKALATDLQMSPNALKVRACRLRLKLETCINKHIAETKSSADDTYDREGSK